MVRRNAFFDDQKNDAPTLVLTFSGKGGLNQVILLFLFLLFLFVTFLAFGSVYRNDQCIEMLKMA